MTDFSSATAWQNTTSELALGARSQLVSDFFDHMNRQNLDWVVMNNYEGLPQVIPSDIDFSIPPELFHRLDGFVREFGESTGADIVQKLWHGNMKCAYILVVGPEGAREFVQLDFFTAFSTKGCPALITHSDLVKGRRALRNFHVPRPEIELIFTAMRRLFKDDWSARHCGRIAELHERITDVDWLPAHYEWLRPTLEAAIRGEVKTVTLRRSQDWSQLRNTAAGNLSVSQKIANAVLQTRRICARLRDETGQLIVLAAPRNSISAVELVFHRRLFLEGNTSVTLPAKIALLKRRKGLIFVLAGAEHSDGWQLAHRLERLGLVDQVLYQLDGQNLADHKTPATMFGSDVEAIKAIVSIQAAKADRAIARGGSQTSGLRL